jgi:prophage DNA circulation protein
MDISNVPSQWRGKYQQAMFRDAIFFVETDARQGGRRVALHEYPKRNVPYAEDMGRKASHFTVQGYLIGHWPYTGNPREGTQDQAAESYLDLKDRLIDALEADGPGRLRLPLPYRMSDIDVMVQTYSISESRERGGVAVVEMEFIEYGDPLYRQVAWSPAQIAASAANVEAAVTGPATDETAQEVTPYSDTWVSGNVGS